MRRRERGREKERRGRLRERRWGVKMALLFTMSPIALLDELGTPAEALG